MVGAWPTISLLVVLGGRVRLRGPRKDAGDQALGLLQVVAVARGQHGSGPRVRRGEEVGEPLRFAGEEEPAELPRPQRRRLRVGAVFGRRLAEVVVVAADVGVDAFAV